MSYYVTNVSQMKCRKEADTLQDSCKNCPVKNCKKGSPERAFDFSFKAFFSPKRI